MFKDPIPPRVAAKIEGVTEVAMLKWRRAGRGPRWTEQNGRIFYSRSEVLAHARSRMTLEARVVALERALDAVTVAHV